MAFKHEDSDSLQQRKLGIGQFLRELAEHPQLSREDNQTLTNFLCMRSSHQFAAFKDHLTKVQESYAFIGEYTNRH